MILPATVTMLLLVASFKYDGNGAFGENIKNPQRLFYKCQKTIDKIFMTFAATFKGNYSRINGNITELMAIYVSAILFEPFLIKYAKDIRTTLMFFIATVKEILVQREIYC